MSDQGSQIAVAWGTTEEATQGPSDEGAGLRPRANAVPAGLGLSIVTALAAPLEATVSVTSANPGTAVTLRREAGDELGTRPALAAV